MDQIKELSKNAALRTILILRDNEQMEANYQECVLRFFAYLNKYQTFKHLVRKFLSDYSREIIASGLSSKRCRLVRDDYGISG